MNILLIGNPDGFSPGKRSLITKQILENHGHNVKIINIGNVVKLKHHATSLHYLNNNFFLKRYLFKNNIIKNYPLLEEMELRASLLYKEINKSNIKPNVIICQYADDSLIFKYNLNCLKIYDCPTPWAEELKYSHLFDKDYIRKVKEQEIKIFKSSNYVCFYWKNYFNYIKKFIYNGSNFFKYDWACLQNKPKAKYSHPIKIIFIGFLGGYWVNLPLLSYLTKISPFPIDVYGTPKPSPKYGLNYKGYLSNLDIFQQYHFGLVTISSDKLRKLGWSCKQMDYLSYGLPILMPSWRRDPFFKKTSIYYKKENFVTQIKKYANKKYWEKLSNNAYQLAQQFTWQATSKPLIRIIKNYEKGLSHK